MLAQHMSHPSDTEIPAPATVSWASEALKRGCDLFFSLGIAIVAIPVIFAAWLIVRVTSVGPGFYTQVRVGRHGRHYRIYKIRTMYCNCEASSGAAWSTKRDPRVTPIGSIFRALHVDELPQLLNVLRGDMSLVGPRPERPEFVGPLSVKLPNYTERLLVRPGVTGLAQIQLPPDTSIESVRTKLVLDRCYVKNRSIWLDLRIMLGTVIYLVGFSFTCVRKLARLPNPLADQEVTALSHVHRVGAPFRVMSLFQSQRDDSVPPRSLSNEGGPIPCSESP